jgi:hypothetical protein
VALCDQVVRLWSKYRRTRAAAVVLNLNLLLASLTLVFLAAPVTLQPFAIFSNIGRVPWTRRPRTATASPGWCWCRRWGNRPGDAAPSGPRSRSGLSRNAAALSSLANDIPLGADRSCCSSMLSRRIPLVEPRPESACRERVPQGGPNVPGVAAPGAALSPPGEILITASPEHGAHPSPSRPWPIPSTTTPTSKQSRQHGRPSPTAPPGSTDPAPPTAAQTHRRQPMDRRGPSRTGRRRSHPAKPRRMQTPEQRRDPPHRGSSGKHHRGVARSRVRARASSRSTAPSTRCGKVSPAQHVVLAAEILAGRRVGVLIDPTTLAFFDPQTRQLLRTRPNPLTPEPTCHPTANMTSTPSPRNSTPVPAKAWATAPPPLCFTSLLL